MTKKPDTSAPETPARPLTPIPRAQRKLAELDHTTWAVTAAAHLQPSDFENPALWQAMDNMKRGDHVEIMQNNRWTECLVWDHGPGAVFMRVLQTIELPERGGDRLADIPDGYAIMRALPEHGVIGEYSVIRLKDGAVLNQHAAPLNTYSDARAYLLDSAAVRQPGKSYRG